MNPDPDFLPIQDPGSMGQKGTRSRTQNTVCQGLLFNTIPSCFYPLTPSPDLLHTVSGMVG
jgi:hypothetical protein